MKRHLLPLTLTVLLSAALAAPAGPKTFDDHFPSIAVPDELADSPLAQDGFVDVTGSMFGADPTGVKDSTQAIQKAVIFAREHRMVCYFPLGTYLVSDTIECLHGRIDPARGVTKARSSRDWPCILLGESRGGKRPVIRLADRAAGFGDAKRSKYVLHFWARGIGREQSADEPQPNINMNQMLIGIDLHLGRDNPGAVAIRHRGAQGSSVQDCTIDATGGKTGLEGGCGSGGSHINVTVRGGRIGVDVRETQPAATLTGLTLIDQTGPAVLASGRQATTLVGCRIVRRSPKPAIESLARYYPHHSQMCLVDTSIQYTEPYDGPAVEAGASITMHNVYIAGASQVITGTQRPTNRDGSKHQRFTIAAETGEWTHVRSLALRIDPLITSPRSQQPGLAYKMPIYIDGQRRDARTLVDQTAIAEPPADLVSRHVWPDDFPRPGDPRTVNVKHAPYHAGGEGKTDDTAAIQRAIDEHDIVFLPRGIYRITRPLTLRANTKLIGAARCFTWLVPTPGGAFDDAAHPTAVIKTVNDADAQTALAFIGIKLDPACRGACFIDWRAGRRSILRAVNLTAPIPWHLKGSDEVEAPNYNWPTTVITGHGGGRWYNFHNEAWHFQGPAYRHLLIDGTSQSLRLYQCNPEHSRGDSNMTIRHAKNVDIFGLKSEYNHTVLDLHDAQNIRVFGYGGVATALPGEALFIVDRCRDYLLANLVDTPYLEGKNSDAHFAGRGVDPAAWHMLKETTETGDTITTRPMDRPVLYQRGRPHP
ncbi:hypothetical protein HED60_09150 [Planctomycetales bacterium ZRK34]|nr:hypothetical protein HED60_09150 [Planctomycetales bacterium ZRK34]